MRYTTLIIVLISSFANADEYSCLYLPKDELETKEIDKCFDFTKWLKRPNDSDALLTKKVALTAYYDKNQPAYLYSKAGILYFHKNGKMRRTITVDNGPDTFSDGLARYNWDEKIGFINTKLDVVIQPKYDFAFPFENGVSLVCNSCTFQKDGEYTNVVGGKWGYINTQGDIVVQINYSRNDAYKALNKRVNLAH